MNCQRSSDSTPCNTPALTRKGSVNALAGVQQQYQKQIIVNGQINSSSPSGANTGACASPNYNSPHQPSAALFNGTAAANGFSNGDSCFSNNAIPSNSQLAMCSGEGSTFKRKSDSQLEDDADPSRAGCMAAARYKRLNSKDGTEEDVNNRPDYFVQAPNTVGMSTESHNAHRFISSMCTY